MDNIKLTSVSTHNLKSIDVEIPKNSITSIYGRSGGGKSSLAFSTLYQLCRDEFDALESGYAETSEYYLHSYQGTIPTVAISQGYRNSNPRSTLYSYLNLPQILSMLSLDGYDIPKFNKLKLNRIENKCPRCNGQGYLQEVDSLSLVDFKKSISEKPFSPWRTGSFADLYHKTLLAFCESERINTEIPLNQLSETERNKILNARSEKRLDINFKYQGSIRKRRVIFEGMLIFADSKQKHLKSKGDCVINLMCPDCSGSKVNHQSYSSVKVHDIPLIDFLNKPFSYLSLKLQKTMKENALTVLLKSLCDIGLGYLHFSRSMPSLSGGELQKLRFSRLLTTNITGVLFVIDEISSQLNPSDFPGIFGHLKKLAKKNTIVLVEHAKYFIDNSDHKIHIGPEAGDNGGYICKDKDILPINIERIKEVTNEYITFANISKHNVINQSVSIPKKRISVFTGLPGSGKSSIALAINEMGGAIYISQKFSSYGNRSILAGTIKVANYIADYFSKETGVSSDNFILSKKAGCMACCGTGAVKYDKGFEGFFYATCPDCEGKMFDENNENLKIKVAGLSVRDFYNMSISELYFEIKDKKNIPNMFTRILDCMVQLELGHLQLIRKTQTLSGGEMRRVKLSEYLYRQKETKKVLIMDEPVAGLDPETASKVAKFICEKIPLFAAIIMIEHREEIIALADYQVKIGPFSGPLGGQVLSQEFLI